MSSPYVPKLQGISARSTLRLNFLTGSFMSNPHTVSAPAAAAGTFALGGDLPVNRMGFGAMRLTGKGIWGPPRNRGEAIRVLQRAVELGVNFFDTAYSYGPHVSEEIIAEALSLSGARDCHQGRTGAPRAGPVGGERPAGVSPPEPGGKPSAASARPDRPVAAPS